MNSVTEDFCRSLPKIELHAHLNGSISPATIDELVSLRKERDPQYKGLTDDQVTCIKKGEARTLSEVFQLFPIVQSLTDCPKALTLATKRVVAEFADENVVYLELRTTPRANEHTQMTKEQYVCAVLKGLVDGETESQSRITTGLILSLDRRQSLEEADDTVSLALRLRESSEYGKKVVGIDLSGDPSHQATHFIPLLRKARDAGLFLSLHLAESPTSLSETMELIRVLPHRIGHGTFLLPKDGGSDDYVAEVQRNKIPLELCLTSNVKCKTVSSYDNHHLKFWHDANHPIAICTDDSGIFDTNLSKEYFIASQTLQLNSSDLIDLSLIAMDCSFATHELKTNLKQVIAEFKRVLQQNT